MRRLSGFSPSFVGPQTTGKVQVNLYLLYYTSSFHNQLGKLVVRYYFSAEDWSRTDAEEFNPLTPRVKPWMIQSFLTFDSKTL